MEKFTITKIGRYCRLAFGLVLIIITTGCVSASVTRLGSNNQNLPALKPEEVSIYIDEADIRGEWQKVALINLKGSYSATNEEKMFKKARKEAAKIGANGVLVKEVNDPSTAQKVWGALLGTGAERKGQVIAIFVKPE